MLNELIIKHSVDAIFLSDLNTIRYLFNFTGSNGFVIKTKKTTVFVTDTRYELQAHKEVKNALILIYDNKLSFINILVNIVKKYRLKKIGFFSDKTLYSGFVNLQQLKVQLVPISYSLSILRMIKKSFEIRNIKNAIMIQERAFEASIALLFKTPSEAQFANFLDANMLLNGAEKSAFDTIVAFGKNSACPHHSFSNKKISGTGSLIIDFGAVYKSYCSDQTVTIFFGKVSNRLEKLYDLVYEARARVFKMIKPGVKISYLQNLVDKLFDENACLKFSKHSLGHGLGLEIHEEPLNWRNSDIVLEENMVFTIEPGLYIPNIGGVRLEYVVLVKQDGLDILSKIPKEKKYVL